MKVFVAPELPSVDREITIFLAGSIEQDKAVQWQQQVIEHLKQHERSNNLVVFNPRRTAWNASLVQSADNPMFAEQVNWELDQLDVAHITFFYFQPGTLSPISLAELGKVLGRGTADLLPVIVVCPEGYWRRGNVEIMCQREGILICNSLEEGLQELDDAITGY